MRRFVRSIAQDRIAAHPTWPANVFKLECESYGIYQDFTGGVLKELLEEDEIGKSYLKQDDDEEIHAAEVDDDNSIPFFTDPNSDFPLGSEVQKATMDFYTFVSNRALYAELAAYAALCKVCDEVGQDILMDVLPKSYRSHQLHGVNAELDGLVTLHGEHVPVEVYNGLDYLGTSSDKYQDQLEGMSSDEYPASNPLLINRRADEAVRNGVRTMNGMVVNTDLMLGCEATNPELPEVLDLLRLDEIVELCPPLKTSEEMELNGREYSRLALSGPGAPLRPASKMVPGAEQLSDHSSKTNQYLKRVRGGIHLLYVNTFYRRAGGPTEREASLVLQRAYNILLREGGHDVETLLSKGWDSAMDQYRNIKSAEQRKDMILDKTREYLTTLNQENIVSDRNGEYHARRSEHPQPSLSFSP
jgi:hypothetical protein